MQDVDRPLDEFLRSSERGPIEACSRARRGAEGHIPSIEDDEDALEDHFTIDRVERGRIWLEAMDGKDLGPIALRPALARQCKVGWEIAGVVEPGARQMAIAGGVERLSALTPDGKTSLSTLVAVLRALGANLKDRRELSDDEVRISNLRKLARNRETVRQSRA